MSTYSEIDEEKLSLSDMPDELFKKVRRSVGLIGNSQKGDPYHGSEKRSRREIANCNERRRMQSINSGFESLKTLLPTEDGEKLSKAAILQLTSKYIQHLVGENRRMRDQLSQMQQQQQHQQQPPQQPRNTDVLLAASDVALRKRKLPAAPDDNDGGGGGGGGGGVYIGYFQQQGNHTIIRAQPQQQQQQHHPTFQLAVKPDYEQFVIEPPVHQLQQHQQQQHQQLPLPTKPKRLEHLMMAIERIEGQSNLQQQQEQNPNQSQSIAVSSERRPCSTEAARCLLQQQQQQQPQPAVMISPFTPQDTSQPADRQQQQQQPIDDEDAAEKDSNLSLSSQRLVVVDLAAAAAAAAVESSPHSAAGSSDPDSPGQCRPRAIPHKYLHRPQVVQANRSN